MHQLTIKDLACIDTLPVNIYCSKERKWRWCKVLFSWWQPCWWSHHCIMLLGNFRMKRKVDRLLRYDPTYICISSSKVPECAKTLSIGYKNSLTGEYFPVKLNRQSIEQQVFLCCTRIKKTNSCCTARWQRMWHSLNWVDFYTCEI